MLPRCRNYYLLPRRSFVTTPPITRVLKFARVRAHDLRLQRTKKKKAQALMGMEGKEISFGFMIKYELAQSEEITDKS